MSQTSMALYVFPFLPLIRGLTLTDTADTSTLVPLWAPHHSW